ncbi:hypothetical protein BD289DRAFT_484729 [Coniella lustricola]|uniref:Uncharacterized protein n=1 Tax=Coniella lustricola TaxID=2025994 RepID=A0A2T3A0Y6_9PEZI|nr:hypothetical protein BD289DRAFT_484729 [Coniella lustricola]
MTNAGNGASSPTGGMTPNGQPRSRLSFKRSAPSSYPYAYDEMDDDEPLSPARLTSVSKSISLSGPNSKQVKTSSWSPATRIPQRSARGKGKDKGFNGFGGGGGVIVGCSFDVFDSSPPMMLLKVAPMIEVTRSITLAGVSEEEFIFADELCGPGWYVIRCNPNGRSAKAGIAPARFQRHPFQHDLALHHFNNKSMECHNMRRKHTVQDIIREFAYRVYNDIVLCDDPSEADVESSNQILAEKPDRMMSSPAAATAAAVSSSSSSTAAVTAPTPAKRGRPKKKAAKESSIERVVSDVVR